jgi:hypothetical protein
MLIGGKYRSKSMRFSLKTARMCGIMGVMAAISKWPATKGRRSDEEISPVLYGVNANRNCDGHLK